MSHYKPDPNKSVNLNIDGIPVTVPEGTTILEAARKANVLIPTLCDHPELCRRAVCRICVVECDGRGKLVAACANSVWEAVNVVTHNARLMNVRKTIIELLLADHPQDCLGCVKNTQCELQNLASTFGIRTSPFRQDVSSQASTENRLQETSGETLVKDMSKCVKCGRCVDVCQEAQTVRAINTSHRSIAYEICTPYNQALSEGPCILCGQCAVVCPVGAIYEHDDTARVWSALNKSERALTMGERMVIAAFPPSIAAALDSELELPAGTITSGKIVSALELMGFSFVYDSGNFTNMTIAQQERELQDRIKSSGKLHGKQPGCLPMISACLPGFHKFVKEFYPDLLEHLSVSKSPEQNFKAYAREQHGQKAVFVSIAPCIAKKNKVQPTETSVSGDEEIVLTPQEFARMIRLSGIDLSAFPESPFSGFSEARQADPKATALVVNGLANATLLANAALVVNGLANARIVMESIRNGECDADLVEIISCQIGSRCPNSHAGF